MTHVLKQYLRQDCGAVTISASWLIGVFALLIGGGVELAHAYWQTNAMQHASKIGVRIATTSEPVATVLTTMTGLEGNIAEAGDPMPSYKLSCSGKTQTCDQGEFNQAVFNKIVFGRDNDGKCGATSRERRGMCDYFKRLKAENISITYEASGMGRAGNPADLVPLVTVNISDVEKNYIFLDVFGDISRSVLLNASAMAIAEDLE